MDRSTGGHSGLSSPLEFRKSRPMVEAELVTQSDVVLDVRRGSNENNYTWWTAKGVNGGEGPTVYLSRQNDDKRLW